MATNGGREDWYRARLMAAAPRLRDALQGLRDTLHRHDWDLHPDVKAALQEATRALDSIPQPGRLRYGTDPEQRHIAREGETEYASIHRNRSGQDAGCIDFGVRVAAVEALCEADKQELRSTVRALYDTVVRMSS
jgi:hypothetical protein